MIEREREREREKEIVSPRGDYRKTKQTKKGMRGSFLLGERLDFFARREFLISLPAVEKKIISL